MWRMQRIWKPALCSTVGGPSASNLILPSGSRDCTPCVTSACSLLIPFSSQAGADSEQTDAGSGPAQAAAAQGESGIFYLQAFPKNAIVSMRLFRSQAGSSDAVRETLHWPGHSYFIARGCRTTLVRFIPLNDCSGTEWGGSAPPHQL